MQKPLDMPSLLLCGATVQVAGPDVPIICQQEYFA